MTALRYYVFILAWFRVNFILTGKIALKLQSAKAREFRPQERGRGVVQVFGHNRDDSKTLSIMAREYEMYLQKGRETFKTHTFKRRLPRPGSLIKKTAYMTENRFA